MISESGVKRSAKFSDMILEPDIVECAKFLTSATLIGVRFYDNSMPYSYLHSSGLGSVS